MSAATVALISSAVLPDDMASSQDEQLMSVTDNNDGVGGNTRIDDSGEIVPVDGYAPDVWRHPLPRGSGYFISSTFNGRYFDGTLERHYGTDLAVGYGTEIRAVHDGVVTMCQPWGTYGNFVEIRHSEELQIYSRYGHASTLLCEVGEVVKAGDVVALVGSTGRSSGNHLHFEIRYGGGDDPTARTFSDPIYFMRAHGVDLETGAEVASGDVVVAPTGAPPDPDAEDSGDQSAQ